MKYRFEKSFPQILKKLYRECGLVHADLSEYNLLWWRDQVWVIDVSQSVDITHPAALEFLYRDSTNVVNVSIDGLLSVSTSQWEIIVVILFGDRVKSKCGHHKSCCI